MTTSVYASPMPVESDAWSSCGALTSFARDDDEQTCASSLLTMESGASCDIECLSRDAEEQLRASPSHLQDAAATISLSQLLADSLHTLPGKSSPSHFSKYCSTDQSDPRLELHHTFDPVVQRTLRRRFPLVQIQDRPLHERPLLLCWLVEASGIKAPGPQVFLQNDLQAKANAWEDLISGVNLMLCNLETHSARPPSHGDSGHRSLPSNGRRRVATLRESRFEPAWWVNWLKEATQVSQEKLASNAQEQNSRNGSCHQSWLVETVKTRLSEHDVNNTIPQELRPALWLWMARGPRLELPHADSARLPSPMGDSIDLSANPRISLDSSRGLSDEVDPWDLAERYVELSSSILSGPYDGELETAHHQILCDLARTPPELFLHSSSILDAGRVVEGRGQAAERLLMAYSHHRPDVGYCQGLNFIVAILLSVLDEQSAFAVFDCLLKRLPVDCYSCDPEKLQRCRTAEQERVRMALVAERPALAEHVAAIDLDLNFFLPRWLTCLFAPVLPPQATVRIVDRVLGEDGADALPRLALAVLCRAEVSLLATKDVREALDVLSATTASVTPYDIDMMLGPDEWPAWRLERASAAANTISAEQETIWPIDDSDALRRAVELAARFC